MTEGRAPYDQLVDIVFRVLTDQEVVDDDLRGLAEIIAGEVIAAGWPRDES